MSKIDEVLKLDPVGVFQTRSGNYLHEVLLPNGFKMKVITDPRNYDIVVTSYATL